MMHGSRKTKSLLDMEKRKKLIWMTCVLSLMTLRSVVYVSIFFSLYGLMPDISVNVAECK